MVRVNHASPCLLEHMEERRLLSADAAVTLEEGTLNVRGTNGDDAIVVSLDAADATKLSVTVNGVSHSFNLADILQVKMIGKRGNDSLVMDETVGAILLPAHLVGGPGNDVMVGASGDDKLLGGKDDDHMTGNAGADKMKGAHGDDIVNGNAGEDMLDGGKGADKLKGGRGEDDYDEDRFDDVDDVDDVEQDEEDEEDELEEVEPEDDLLA